MLMHFRIKNFDRYVGIFVILALFLLVVALVFIARGQRWFEARNHFRVVFNKVQGLKAGTPVTISGMEVGTVKTLHLTPEGKVELVLEILSTYRGYIRQDSQATVVSALLGGKTVEISMGSPQEPPIPEGGTLYSQEPKELTDILKEVDLKAPLKKVDDALDKVNDALDNVKGITEKLNSPKGELFTMLKNIEFVTAQLKNGQGNIGALLQDKKIYNDLMEAFGAIRQSAANLEVTTRNASAVSQDLPKVVAEVEERIKEVKGILVDVKQTTAGLPRVMENVQKASEDAPRITGDVKDITKEVKDITGDVKGITGDVKQTTPELPDFLASTQETLEEAERLIQGLQNHWLLRGSMPKMRADTPVEISQRESPYEKKGDLSR